MLQANKHTNYAIARHQRKALARCFIQTLQITYAKLPRSEQTEEIWNYVNVSNSTIMNKEIVWCAWIITEMTTKEQHAWQRQKEQTLSSAANVNCSEESTPLMTIMELSELPVCAYDNEHESEIPPPYMHMQCVSLCFGWNYHLQQFNRFSADHRIVSLANIRLHAAISAAISQL